jgi:hypothetical protein
MQLAGLTDMEELIATVDDKEIAAYLKEALVCYSTGATRACVVMSNIALFEGMRRKIRKLAPVSSVAKKVSEEIEPLAEAQKVFETPLIHRLRAASIITELEAQLLEQLNSQRNKAAHPSGHTVTPEEARFVFSEVIQKFLSLPIRETSFVVERVMGSIGNKNFFPSSNLADMSAVVAEEIKGLDTLALPFLIAKLVPAYESTDADLSRNAINFLLALTSMQQSDVRDTIIKKLFAPKSSDDKNAEFFSMMITCDPMILSGLDTATKQRCRALLLKNAESIGVSQPYLQLRQPAHVLGRCLIILGEQFMLTEMQAFVDWVVARTPYAPEFVREISKSPTIFGGVFQSYLDNAASSQWSQSNPFAAAAPALDAALANAISDEKAFALIVAIVRGADWNGHGPQAIANSAFATMPALKAKAINFAAANAISAQTIILAASVNHSLNAFVAKYLV